MKDRLTWDEYFIGLAEFISIRSHDLETQVGCVIVDDNNHVIGLGYNGFCSGVDDSELPKTRPDKYPFIVHAEQNALANMSLKSSAKKRAYITAYPCSICAKLLWQNGIKNWHVSKGGKAHSFDNNDAEVISHLKSFGLTLEEIPVKTKVSLL